MSNVRQPVANRHARWLERVVLPSPLTPLATIKTRKGVCRLVLDHRANAVERLVTRL